MPFYLVTKNGEQIYAGDEYDHAIHLIPFNSRDQGTNDYRLYELTRHGGEIIINARKINYVRSNPEHLVNCDGDVDHTERIRLKIPQKDLEFLVEELKKMP